MPITKSAKKALRQNKKRHLLNLRRKKQMKNLIKQIRKFVEEKNQEKAKQILPQAYKAIDKALKRGIIKKNTAARKKSYLALLINRMNK